MIAEVFAAVAGGPVLGIALGTHVKCARLKGFKGDVIVEIVVVADRIEIPAAAVNRQISTPVIFHPAVDDILAHTPPGDAVRPAAQRGRGKRIAELVIFPELLRHDRQGKQAEHILFARFRKLDAHRERGDGFHRCALVDQAKLRHPFSHKFMEGKDDVAGGDGRAVVKGRAGIKRDLHPRIVIGIACYLGNQRIIAAGFIVGGGVKRVIE